MPATGGFTNPNDPWGFSNPLGQMFGQGGYGGQTLNQMTGNQWAGSVPDLEAGDSDTATRQAMYDIYGGRDAIHWLGGLQAVSSELPSIEFAHYDPLKFNPVGRPPATPTANADVASQSQVIRTPEEIRTQYDKEQAKLDAQLKESSAVLKNVPSIGAAQSELTKSIMANLGGRQTLGTGPDGTNTRNILMPQGGTYTGVPREYIDAHPEFNYGTASTDPDGSLAETVWLVDGATRYPKLNNVYAQDMTGQIKKALMAGQDPSGILPTTLSSRPDIAEALTGYQDAYAAQQALPDFGPGNRFTHPSLIKQAQSVLEGSYNTYVQDYYGNQQAQGQAYLDMMGGGAFGGVLPSATNPQWYDTTPTMMPPGRLDEAAAQDQAMNSPWGQAGAPWASQAWAGGVFNPTSGPQFSQNGQVQPNPSPWFGSQGMFGANQFNPQMVVNAPWATPTKPTSGGGMSFGSSPWGSFW